MDWKRAAIAAVAFVIAYSFVEPYLLRVNEVTVSSSDVPAGFDGKRIMFISDIHCGPFLSLERVQGVVDLSNGMQPDMVLLGGDYITGDGDNIGRCIPALSGLKAPLGVFAVLGNHDNWAGGGKVRDALSASGIRVLDNQAVWIASSGSRIRVGGVGDMWTEKQDLNPTLEGTVKGDFVLLISHNPQYADDIPADAVDLMLSGHTHGGQLLPVRLLTYYLPARLLAPYLPFQLRQKYLYGTYETGTTRLIVTDGVGTVFAPVRLMTPPEILVINLKTAPKT
jgi:uncharacterized protein